MADKSVKGELRISFVDDGAEKVTKDLVGVEKVMESVRKTAGSAAVMLRDFGQALKTSPQETKGYERVESATDRLIKGMQSLARAMKNAGDEKGLDKMAASLRSVLGAAEQASAVLKSLTPRMLADVGAGAVASAKRGIADLKKDIDGIIRSLESARAVQRQQTTAPPVSSTQAESTIGRFLPRMTGSRAEIEALNKSLNDTILKMHKLALEGSGAPALVVRTINTDVVALQSSLDSVLAKLRTANNDALLGQLGTRGSGAGALAIPEAGKGYSDLRRAAAETAKAQEEVAAAARKANNQIIESQAAVAEQTRRDVAQRAFAATELAKQSAAARREVVEDAKASVAAHQSQRAAVRELAKSYSEIPRSVSGAGSIAAAANSFGNAAAAAARQSLSFRSVLSSVTAEAGTLWDRLSARVSAYANTVATAAQRTLSITPSQGFTSMVTGLSSVVQQLSASFGGFSAGPGAQFVNVLAQMAAGVGSVSGALVALGLVLSVTVVGAVGAVIRSGLEMNQMLENAQIHLTGLFLTFNTFPGAATGIDRLNAALGHATVTQQKLQRAAFSTLVTYQDLVKGFSALYAMGATGGGTVDELIDLSVSIANFAASQGRSFESMARQMAIVEGGVVRMTGTMGELMRAMGVDNKTIKSWREQGVTVHELNKYFKEFLDITPLVEGSWANIKTNFKLIQDLFSAKASEPMFGLLKKYGADLLSMFSSVKDGALVLNRDTSEAMSAIGVAVSAMVSGSVDALLSLFGILRDATSADTFRNTMVDMADKVVRSIILLRGMFGYFVGEAKIAIYQLGETYSEVMVPILEAVASGLPGFFAPQKKLAEELLAGAKSDLAEYKKELAGLTSLVTEGPRPTRVTRQGHVLEEAGPGAGVATLLTTEQERMSLRMDKATRSMDAQLFALERLKAGATSTGAALSGMGRKPLPPDPTETEKAAKALQKWIDYVEKSKVSMESAAPAVDKYAIEIEGATKKYGLALLDIQKHAREALAGGVSPAKVEADKIALLTDAATQYKRALEGIDLKWAEKQTKATEQYESAMADLNDRIGDYLILTEEDKIVAKFDKQRDAVANLTEEVIKRGNALADLAGQMDATFDVAAFRAFVETRARQAEAIVAGQIGESEAAALGPEKAKTQALAGDWAALWENIKQQGTAAKKSVQDQYSEMAKAVTEYGTSASDGFIAAFYDIKAKIPNAAQSVMATVNEIWSGLTRSFDDLFFNVLTARFDSLADVFRAFGDTIMRAFSKLLSDMVMRWIAGGDEMSGSGPIDALKSMGSGTISGVSNRPAWEGGFGGGGQGGATWGGAAAGGMIGVGVGSAIGGIGNGKYNMAGAQIGGAVGGVAGAMGIFGSTIAGMKIGSAGGWIGAIIGAIVGLIIGALMSPNTENHVTGLIARMITGTTVKEWVPQISEFIPGEGGHIRTPGDGGGPGPMPGEGPGEWVTRQQGGPINAVERAGANVFESMFGWVSDLLRLGAKDQWTTLTEEYKRRLVASLQGSKFDVAAGSQEDIEKTIQAFLTNILPRMSLSAAFGQTGYLPAGNRDAAGGMAGFDYWTSEMDKDGGWIKKQLYDPNAPIPLMLAGLGFTQGKISEIAERLSTDDPEKFKAYLQGLVGVVVAMDELIAGMKGTGADIMARLAEEATKSPAEQFAKVAKELSARYAELEMFTGDELVKRTQEVVAATQEALGQLEQYLDKIRQTSEQIAASISQQIENIEYNLMTPWQKLESVKGVASGSIGKIQAAKTPEEVARLAQEAQDAVGQVLDALFARIARAKELMTGLVDLQAKWASSTDPKKNPFTSFSEDVVKLQQDIEAATKLSGDDQLDAIDKVRAAAEDLYQRQQQLLADIASALATIQGDVKGRLETIDELMRTPAESLAFKRQQAETAMAGIGAATTPQEVTDLVRTAGEAISSLVSTLAAQIQRAEALKTSIQDIAGKLGGGLATPDTVASWFADAAKLQADAAAAAKLSGTEQLDALDKVNTAAVDLYQRQQQYLQQIAAMLETLTTSLDDQIRGIGESLMEADEKLWTRSNQAWAGRGALGAATDPAAVQKAVQDAQAAVGEIINALLARLQQGKALAAGISDIAGKFAAGPEYADPGTAYARDAAEMNRLVAEAATLSGQAQLDAIEKVKASAEDLYQRQQQMISAIDSNVKSLRQSIEKQKWDIQMSLMNPEQQVASIEERVRTLMAQIPTAGSAEEIQRITGEIQGLYSQYYGMFQDGDPRREEAAKKMYEQLDMLQSVADEAYGKLRKQITDSNEAIRKGLETAGKLVEDNMASTATEIDAWRQFLVDIRGEMQQKLKGMGFDIEQAGRTTAEALGDSVAGVQREIDATKAAIDAWRAMLVKLLGNAEGKLDDMGKPLENAGPIIAGALGTAVGALKTNVELATAEIVNWKNFLGFLKTTVGDALVNMANAISLAFTGNKREGIPGLVDAMEGARQKITSVGTKSEETAPKIDSLGVSSDRAAVSVGRLADAIDGAITRINAAAPSAGLSAVAPGTQSSSRFGPGEFVATARAYSRVMLPRTAMRTA